MLVVRVRGGLGNQISQYAFSRLLSKKYPSQEVKLDISFFAESGICEFELPEYFKREYQVFKTTTRYEAQKITKIPNYGMFYLGFLERCMRKMKLVLRDALGINTVICQPITSGYPVPPKIFQLDLQKNWYFDGTWHNFDYTEILPELRTELIYRDCENQNYAKWKEKILNSNSVSVHIRQGDYVGTERDILPQSNYYKNAIELMKSRIGKEIKVFVFSDDVKFANEYFAALGIDCDYQIVTNTGRPAYTDMEIMSLCRANICANSTYSYWAACLNKRSNGLFSIPAWYTRTREIWKVPYGIVVPLD